MIYMCCSHQGIAARFSVNLGLTAAPELVELDTFVMTTLKQFQLSMHTACMVTYTVSV